MLAMFALVLPLWLGLAPPETDYPHAVAQLDTALGTVGAEGTSTSESVNALVSALDHVAQFPKEAPGDGDTLDKMGKARLALAWYYLVDDNIEAANAAMDEALRSARGTALPSGTFGPKVRALHDERQRVLKEQGTAVIEVDCGTVDCQVVVDERRSANPSDPLYLGTYRVWIGARDGSRWEFYEVQLVEPGGGSQLVYVAGIAVELADGPKPLELEDDPKPFTPSEPNRKPNRIMPVWAEALGIVAGVGAIVVGGVLLALDDRCSTGGQKLVNLSDAEKYEVCGESKVYQNKPQAYALFGVGGAAMLSFGVMLSVDQVRGGGARGKQAMLTWTLRF